ncbi:putative OPA3-like protein CG13603 isoform X1 [Ischnura elegans]|uniref:putative OPA3-like protein CG13603 isoform X1 n=1 Tax=Ischnura elegans TaxID=197161 RepID=UPI001ED86C4B|nr:putative OPA3-like protein CG13603 isoform X1 [Ischnura elegans]
MVVGAFPVAKLGGLILKQISKPIANILKERAKKSHFFRTYVCMPPAQFYNWCEVKAKMWVMNLGRPVNIPSLNEAMAIELGANLLGEGIIFSIAAGLLFLEYSRQVRKEAAKETVRIEEMETLNYTIRELYFQAERQDAQIRELMRTVCELESHVTKKPKKCLTDGEPHLHEEEPPFFEGGLLMEAIEYLHKEHRKR